MEIVLHAGLHKTGTTSLQRALLARYAQRVAGKPWYPSPNSHGPGHAEMAWRWLGILDHRGRPDSSELIGVVADARAGQCSKLILSAEDFSWAYPDHMERLAEIASFGDVRVVVTLSQMGRRGISLWQQSVHAGHECSLAESEKLIVDRIIEPEFLVALVSAFGKDRVKVIIVDRDGSPSQMFKHFTDATAVPMLPLSENEFSHANKSMSAHEAELVRLSNECCRCLGVESPTQVSLQTALRRVFSDERWIEATDSQPVRMPVNWRMLLRDRARDTIGLVADMDASGKLDVYGDVDNLDDLSRHQPAAEGSLPEISPQELARISTIAAVLLHRDWLSKVEELQDVVSRQQDVVSRQYEALRECRKHIDVLQVSKSWRFTAPMRALAARARRAFSRPHPGGSRSRRISIKGDGE